LLALCICLKTKARDWEAKKA